MYSLLTPIRYVLNPRFNLQSPLQSGLFYIAPGCGYLFGTFFGGRYADYIVKKYITIRGERVAEDRLRSCLLFLGGVIPACMLIYGWSVEKRVGGVALPVIMMFLQGIAQLFCFPSLNTYCLDVMQGRSAEVVGEYSALDTTFFLLLQQSDRYQLVITSCATCLQQQDLQPVSQLFELLALGGSPQSAPFSWSRVRVRRISLRCTGNNGVWLLTRRRLRKSRVIIMCKRCLPNAMEMISGMHSSGTFAIN